MVGVTVDATRVVRDALVATCAVVDTVASVVGGWVAVLGFDAVVAVVISDPSEVPVYISS